MLAKVALATATGDQAIAVVFVTVAQAHLVIAKMMAVLNATGIVAFAIPDLAATEVGVVIPSVPPAVTIAQVYLFTATQMPVVVNASEN